jgi:hypothetical protein
MISGQNEGVEKRMMGKVPFVQRLEGVFFPDGAEEAPLDPLYTLYFDL